MCIPAKSSRAKYCTSIYCWYAGDAFVQEKNFPLFCGHVAVDHLDQLAHLWEHWRTENEAVFGAFGWNQNFLAHFINIGSIRGQIKSWSAPWKAKFWFKFHLIALCRRNYLSGQSCLPCLWEHCREANDGFSCNCIVCICTGERLPNGKFLLYGGAVDIWLIWRGEQFLKLLLDPYFGCRGSLFHLKLGPYF